MPKMTQREFELVKAVVAKRSGEDVIMQMVLDMAYAAMQLNDAGRALKQLADSVLFVRYVLIEDQWAICPKSNLMRTIESFAYQT